MESADLVSGAAGAPPVHDLSSQDSFVARAKSVVEERCAEGSDCFDESQHEMDSVLLHAKSAYSDEALSGFGGLASFEPGSVSLPLSAAGSPLLR